MKWWERLLIVLAIMGVMIIALIILLSFPTPL
jgi:hypothetical protein